MTELLRQPVILPTNGPTAANVGGSVPKGRKKGDHDARRVEIADATCKVILKLGIERASLADIAKEMDCSTGVVMHYHRSKEQLLLFAKNLLFDTVYERVIQAGKDTAGPEKLYAMAHELLPLDASSIDRWRLLAAFNGLAIGNAELMKVQNKRNSRFWSAFERAIRALQGARDLPGQLDPHVEACGIMAFVDGLADQVIMAPKAWGPTQIQGLMRRYLRSLESPLSHARSKKHRVQNLRSVEL